MQLSDTLIENLTSLRNTFLDSSFGKAITGKVSDANNEQTSGMKKSKSKTTVRAERKKNISDAFFTKVSEGQNQKLKSGEGLANIFAKIYNLMKSEHEEDVKRYELQKDFENERREKQSSRDKELFDVIHKLTDGSKPVEKKKEKKDTSSFITKILGNMLQGVKSLFSGILKTVWSVSKFIVSSIYKVTKGVAGLVYGIVKEAMSVVTSFLFEKILGAATSTLTRLVSFSVNKLGTAVVDLLAGLLELIPGGGFLVKGLKIAAVAAGVIATEKTTETVSDTITEGLIGKEALQHYNKSHELAVKKQQIEDYAATTGDYNRALKDRKYDEVVKQHDAEYAAGKASESEHQKDLSKRLGALGYELDYNDSFRNPLNGVSLPGIRDIKTGESVNRGIVGVISKMQGDYGQSASDISKELMGKFENNETLKKLRESTGDNLSSIKDEAKSLAKEIDENVGEQLNKTADVLNKLSVENKDLKNGPTNTEPTFIKQTNVVGSSGSSEPNINVVSSVQTRTDDPTWMKIVKSNLRYT
jgi:hypothetical protein